MPEIEVISFDMDGTLTDLSFVDAVWLEGIPRLYAGKNSLSFEDAQKHVKSEYSKVGRENLEWYDLKYWTQKFDLDVSPEEILGSFKNRIELFPEVEGVLEECRDKGFRLIVVTNARREFLKMEFEKTQIGRYFDYDFSSTSDFCLIKKSMILYQKICNVVEVSPGKMVHVGDDFCFDFDVPRKLGIKTFYLDRKNENTGDFVVHNLRDFLDKLTP